jgi:hypothetical protein
VLFSIDATPGLVTGTEIRNKARIVFDKNAPIDTSEWLNTIDNALPVSSVSPLASVQSSRRFQVNWSGTDAGAGIATYSIYVSENGGPFTVWLDNATTTSAIYDGRPSSTYAFYSIAQDGAGNLELGPVSADASTTTPESPPVQLTSASSRKVHGAAGPFDVNLPLSGTPGVECRSAGPAGNYVLVFTFANPLTRADGASITGTGTFDGGAIGTDPHEYIVNLTGVASGQYLHVTVQGAGDEAGNFGNSAQVVLGILVGDTTGDGSVSGADITQTKAQAGNQATTNNFREDLTLDGSISGADVTVVKTNVGNGLQ